MLSIQRDHQAACTERCRQETRTVPAFSFAWRTSFTSASGVAVPDSEILRPGKFHLNENPRLQTTSDKLCAGGKIFPT